MTATTLKTLLTAPSSGLLIHRMTVASPNFLQLLELDHRLTALLELDSTKEHVLASPWLRLVSSASFLPDKTRSLEAHALARSASMRFTTMGSASSVVPDQTLEAKMTSKPKILNDLTSVLLILLSTDQ